MQPWWLDAVCEKGDWQVCISKDGEGNTLGVLPFYLTKFLWAKVIKMPDLTPFMGVCLNYPLKLQKEEAKFRFQKKVTASLIDQIPETAYSAQRHPVGMTNWLPFLWKKYKQETRYTFLLDCADEEENLFSNFKGSVRTEIRKAQKSVEVIESEDIDLLYSLQEKSFQRQGLKIPFSLSYLRKIDAACKENGARKMLFAKDKNGNFHAGIFLVWDSNTVYNLLLGADTKLRSSGAVQLLLWEGIKLASERNCTFDFEGGMMPHINSIFSAFGGKLTPYHKIYKGGNILFRTLAALKNG